MIEIAGTLYRISDIVRISPELRYSTAAGRLIDPGEQVKILVSTGDWLTEPVSYRSLRHALRQILYAGATDVVVEASS